MMGYLYPTLALVVLLICESVPSVLASQPDEVLGYPRPFSFREITPKSLPYLDEMAMVVSDLHLRTRQGADLEFKRRHASRPVLVPINSEGLGLWGTWICLPKQRLDDIGLTSPLSLKAFDELSRQVYPIIDFPGYWVYEAGADTTDTIPADREVVTIGVTDTRPFEPSSHPHSINRLKRRSFMKDIVICPRDADATGLRMRPIAVFEVTRIRPIIPASWCVRFFPSPRATESCCSVSPSPANPCLSRRSDNVRWITPASDRNQECRVPRAFRR